MRHFLSIIAVVALMVGCEETKVASNSPEAKVAIREAANKPTGELTKADLEKGNTPKEKSRGIKGVYPWGKEWPPPKGAGNYWKRLKVDKFDYTAPVGSFATNQLGLHDMDSNVWVLVRGLE